MGKMILKQLIILKNMVLIFQKIIKFPKKLKILLVAVYNLMKVIV